MRAKLRKKVAFLIDRWRYSYVVQPLACKVLGHEPIEAASWYVKSEGMACAYCQVSL